MKREGIDRSQIEEIPLQFSIVPFLEDQVDVYPTYVNNEPPRLDSMEVDYVVVDPRDYGMDIYSMCYFTTEKMIEENPEVIDRYLQSVVEGYEWALKNKDGAAQLIVAYNETLELDHQRRMLDATEPLLVEGNEGRIGWMDKDKWEATQQVFVDVGILQGNIDLDSLFTIQFLEEIYE